MIISVTPKGKTEIRSFPFLSAQAAVSENTIYGGRCYFVPDVLFFQQKDKRNGEGPVRKELPHFTVGQSYGGNQEWFSERWMKMGGCGAVTACDLCIYLAKYKAMPALYPFDADNVSLEDYLAFGRIMRAYLGPRLLGIHKTQTYVSGFRDYLASIGARPVRLRGVGGEEDEEIASTAIRERIDSGFPVPYLMLRHLDEELHDYTWHWFLLNGYDDSGGFSVKAVTYGESRWLDLRRLWRTGRRKKGGFVLVRPAGAEDGVPYAVERRIPVDKARFPESDSL